eukprot:scaffold30298_cov30-Tisochrysis_lutea.AAC.2
MPLEGGAASVSGLSILSTRLNSGSRGDVVSKSSGGKPSDNTGLVVLASARPSRIWSLGMRCVYSGAASALLPPEANVAHLAMFSNACCPRATGEVCESSPSRPQICVGGVHGDEQTATPPLSQTVSAVPVGELSTSS